MSLSWIDPRLTPPHARFGNLFTLDHQSCAHHLFTYTNDITTSMISLYERDFKISISFGNKLDERLLLGQFSRAYHGGEELIMLMLFQGQTVVKSHQLGIQPGRLSTFRTWDVLTFLRVAGYTHWCAFASHAMKIILLYSQLDVIRKP